MYMLPWVTAVLRPDRLCWRLALVLLYGGFMFSLLPCDERWVLLVTFSTVGFHVIQFPCEPSDVLCIIPNHPQTSLFTLFVGLGSEIWNSFVAEQNLHYTLLTVLLMDIHIQVPVTFILFRQTSVSHSQWALLLQADSCLSFARSPGQWMESAAGVLPRHTEKRVGFFYFFLCKSLLCLLATGRKFLLYQLLVPHHLLVQWKWLKPS